MNRKANVSVLILVLLAVLLCSIALFTFATSSKNITIKIFNTKSISNVYFYEEKTEFLISEMVRGVIADNYENAFMNSKNAEEANSIIKEKLYSQIRVAEEKEEYAISESENNVYILRQDGIAGISAINFEINREFVNLNGKMEQISGALYEGKNGKSWQWGYTQPKEDKKMIFAVIYRPVLNYTFDIRYFGLEGFNSLYNAFYECSNIKENVEIEKCFNGKLPNFSTLIDETQDKKTIVMKSKNKFFIDNRIREIVLRKDILSVQ